MKIEKTVYVIMKVGNIELGEQYATKYMCDKDVDASEFTDDICMAAKGANRMTALTMKHDYDIRKGNGYESDLQIIPLKITHEW